MSQESLLTRVPLNQNLLQLTKFIFTIPDFTHPVYFCQSVNIPGLQTNAPVQPTPFKAAYRHGDTLVVNPLVVTFLVDEDMYSWEQAYDWLRSIAPPHDFGEYAKNQGKSIYKDAILTTLTNSNLENVRIKFKDCHPISLTSLTFDTRVNAEAVPTCILTLRYDSWVVERTP